MAGGAACCRAMSNAVRCHRVQRHQADTSGHRAVTAAEEKKEEKKKKDVLVKGGTVYRTPLSD